MHGVILRSSVVHADGIRLLSFESDGTSSLPPVIAGAHITIALPDGLHRSYSLIDPPGVTDVYTVAIRSGLSTTGGSRYLCESARVGEHFMVTGPANNFDLAEDAANSVFIAGGIGVTPLWSMIQRLEQLQGRWSLHYANRERRAAAFLNPLAALEVAYPGRVHLYFGAEGQRVDIGRIVDAAPLTSILYCCGPASMLDTFKTVTSSRLSGNARWEHFNGIDIHEGCGNTAFTVELLRTGRTFRIEPNETILGVLMNAGVAVDYGCQQGNCGACETRVVAGIPDHRDLVLSDGERRANATMMICCSRSQGDRLILDL